MRVLAFAKYGRAAASTRQRILQYLPRLAEAGIAVEVHPLLDDDYVHSLASGEPYPRSRVAAAYARRLATLLRGSDADLLWIYAELFPWLPAAFERLAFRSRRPVVYEFDDAFHLPYEGRPLLAGKIDPLISGAAACICGNAYLRDHAARLNPNSVIIPTVVDTDRYRPAEIAPTGPPVIGWIGSPSTWDNVRPLLPVLERLCRDGRARVLAIGAGAAAEADRFAGLEFRQWTEDSEIASVQAMDIGIMPLIDEPFRHGKSGYKLVQYMACGLPVVASPVGVNRTMVETGRNGFLATGPDEWDSALSRLLGDPGLRSAMGKDGRARAVGDYSLQSQAPRLIAVLEAAARAG